MCLLADDFFDNWVDWKIELYSAVANFVLDPSVEHHDAVVKVLKEQAGDEVRRLELPYEYPAYSTPVIVIRNDKRKYSWPGSGLYICKLTNLLTCCKSTKFIAEHEVYAIPKEVYETLATIDC